MSEVIDLQRQGEQRLMDALRRNLGDVCMRALEDERVIEVMLNPDGRVWIDKLGEGMSWTGYVMPAAQARSIFSTMSSMLGVTVTEDDPILEGELPLDGSRFEGLLPPVVMSPTFAIRKKASLVFTLEQYVESGILMRRHYDEILRAVDDRDNILIVGSTGSGKTTLVNAVLAAIAARHGDQRIVLMEDTGEVQCKAENVVTLRANANTDMTRLLKATMRLRPDRIVVGEVRGGEALALLKAWNTGHPGGVSTVHANGGEAGLTRLEQLIAEVSMNPMPQLIAEAVNLVLFIKRDAKIKAGRVVSEVVRVKGYDAPARRYLVQAC